MDIHIPAFGLELNLPLTLVAVAIIFAIVDIFLQSEFLTCVGYILISVAVAIVLPGHILLRIFAGLTTSVILVYVHYSLWREFVSRFFNYWIAPTRYRTGGKGLIGSTATICEINGVRMAKAQGDLWPFECDDELEPGMLVTIHDERRGILCVNAEKEHH